MDLLTFMMRCRSAPDHEIIRKSLVASSFVALKHGYFTLIFMIDCQHPE